MSEKKRNKKTMDGNMAAAHVSYAFTEAAAIYPITPSSPMADYTDLWANEGVKNIFGQPVVMSEMQSEAGAAGALHGSLQAGALSTTYTASQGLLLMIPNMYKMAGELLPAVIHVSARALASHALSIFGDHSDVYACRQTGFAMLCAGNVQEVMDLGAVAHLSAIEGRVPFLHFFDGFRTSHEIQKIEVWDYEDLKDMCPMEAVKEFRARALNPHHPVQRGTAQNPDIFFQAREASNGYYDRLPQIVETYMKKVNEKAGTNYQLFNYYGDPEAEKVIVAMGSVCDVTEETIDYLMEKGEKVGLVKVRLFRPFSAEHLVKALPNTVKQIYVLDRSKEPGAQGEALYLDVVAACKDSKFKDVPVFGGRYGLGSKDVYPTDIIAVYRNENKKEFTLGIEDDVTHLSLPRRESPETEPKGTTSCKFWGMGADGTVGANKNSIKIIGDHTDKYVQAYFDYDSKKSGGVTISHLRFGDQPIQSTYLIHKADFVACHTPAYLRKYYMVQDLKPNGSFLLNCAWNQEELEEALPGQVKRYIAENNINLYTIDGYALGKEIGLGGRINTILQSAFFAISEIIPKEEAIQYMKEAAKKTYSKKGEDIVEMNYRAIEAGAEKYVKIDVPESWKQAQDDNITDKVSGEREELIEYVNEIQSKINSQRGNELPVSAFVKYADGTVPLGSSAYEKRGVGIDVPRWNPDGCIQCNFCSYVCPHACIRPLALDEETDRQAPEGTRTEMKGIEGMKFAVTISALDCTGCGNCVNVCPGNMRNDVLEMRSVDDAMYQQPLFDFGVNVKTPEKVFEKFKVSTVKGSQFKKPLLEFSGACAGCGETQYAKLATQMFGDRMYIANATGCSSIWGGSSPASAYTVNHEGEGPAWANSLFEDNAEFGFGMELAQRTLRSKVLTAAETLLQETVDEELKEKLERYLETKTEGSANKQAAMELVTYLQGHMPESEAANAILEYKDFAAKKSQWIFGGDGWAYDIGYGGLDHVLASGQDVNILVFDTEVYSNTGGQASKATPTGAIAQFAAAGKEVKKKDLAAIAMSYGYVYVAQVAMGADMNQTVKAFEEAERYPGPSIIIAYAPCINHGIRTGMGNSMGEEKKAVEAGYWHLFRYNPELRQQGKNPFVLDSKEPKGSYRDFLMGEVRYNRLMRSNPERAESLFDQAEVAAKEKYNELVRRADL
nr:pyruvate:ferredoxin (flavodoxin) oxidoreductase [Eubacterium sp.]